MSQVVTRRLHEVDDKLSSRQGWLSIFLGILPLFFFFFFYLNLPLSYTEIPAPDTREYTRILLQTRKLAQRRRRLEIEVLAVCLKKCIAPHFYRRVSPDIPL